MEQQVLIKTNRDPVLDFWRGISILLVLFTHITWMRFHSFFYGTANEYSREWAPFIGSKIGGFGVYIFFIISGYIITKLLIEEENKRGSINVRTFYIRRFFRIFPTYFVYITLIFISARAGWIFFTSPQVACATFFANTIAMKQCAWSFAHLWSLSVEEQFYLFWPLFIFITKPSMRARYVIIVLLSLILSSLLGLFIYNWLDNGASFASIIAGSLYAVSPHARTIIQTWRKQIIIATFILGIFRLFSSAELYDSLYHLLRLCIPFGVLCLISLTYDMKKLHTSSFFFAMTKLGMISYSLYLWQQPFTDIRFESYSPFSHFILFIPLTLISYFLIEKPVNRWARKRFKLNE